MLFCVPQPANPQSAEPCCQPWDRIRPCLSQLPGAAWLFPYPSPVARTAGLANFSPLPIEPPPTLRTIRGDGRVHLPRAVPAARNVTRRRPAPANGPRRVRRVGTGQTPPVCGRQQEGHPAAADHTPRTDLLTTAWPLRPRRLREWQSAGSGGGRAAAGGPRRQCPAASRLTRVFASFHARPPVVLRLRISGATILAVTGAVRAAQAGFCRVSCSPPGWTASHNASR